MLQSFRSSAKVHHVGGHVQLLGGSVQYADGCVEEMMIFAFWEAEDIFLRSTFAPRTFGRVQLPDGSAQYSDGCGEWSEEKRVRKPWFGDSTSATRDHFFPWG